MRLALITGANAGLGFETARGLLAQDFEVVITSRNAEKAASALQRLREEFPKAVLSSIDLDLSVSSSVDSFASRFHERHGVWDVLVNNAGAKVLQEYGTTDSGVEYHFGVNAVGHFAVTSDLLKHRTNNSRVVGVASIVARFAPSTLGPHGSPQNYSPGASYAASKLSNLLFALELARISQGSGLKSLAAHPGFARAEPYGPKATRFFESFLAQSAESGARPQIAAASKNGYESGSYLGPKVLELWGEVSCAKIPSSCTPENMSENWKILEDLSGRKLVI